MRYWAYLAAKIGLCAAFMVALLRWLNASWPVGPTRFNYIPPRFSYDLQYTLVAGLWFLSFCGLLYLCVWDQRYRCRVCLRRMRMPVETGSWSRMLFLGRPRIEYICPYGHGTLKFAELQISGLENPEWNPHGEIWDELCASARDADQRP
jgi:hypothetical protein